MKTRLSIRKLLLTVLLAASMIVMPGTGVMNTGVSAEAAVRTGFPLPSGKVYYATVLHKYSGGSKHTSYIYTWGALKNKKYDSACLVDIAASGGTPIFAVAAGQIVRNTYTSGGGNQVVIKHNDGTYSYYGHMKNKCSIKKGKTVKAGQQIGLVGKTGSATGNHLHFEWSGHDPYCMYYSWGLLRTKKNSGASRYPHTHAVTISGTTSLSVAPGKTAQIKASVSPRYMTVKWSSSNTSVATVNGSGVVRGVKGGSCTITGKVTNGKKSAALSCKVKVTGTPAPTPAPVTNTWTGYVVGTDGTLAINSRASSGYMIGKIPEGAAMTVYPDKTSGKWYYVKYGSVSGYSYSSYIVRSRPATRAGVIKGTDGTLNIRSGPSTSYKIRGTVKEGKTVTVYTGRASGTWYWICYNGVAGYVSGKYVRLQ